MPGDLGKSQLSSLLETVPGLASVLRSPVADAIVNMVRAGAGLRDFDINDAKELVQYATRRGLIPSGEGARLLEEVKGIPKKGRAKSASAKNKLVKKKTVQKAASKAVAKRKTVKKAASKAVAKKKTVKKAAPKKATKKKTVKKAAKKATAKKQKSAKKKAKR